MEKKLNVPLRDFHTFGLEQQADVMYVADSEEDVVGFVERYDDFIILGAGSNTVFTRDITKPILQISIKGLSILEETDDHVDIMVNAGEVWHDFVGWTVQNDWSGIENLALIPGTVGAAPVQNIGAYGVEVADVITEVRGVDRVTKRIKTLTREQCRFGYRDSVFKAELKEDFIITAVTMRLKKNDHHYQISYKPLQDYLEANSVLPSVREIYEAVIAIRRSKLPDPEEIGNSGSFFKNPVISASEWQQLQEKYPDAPHYEQQDGTIKIPAAWLIEKSGWKGYNKGGVGVYPKHALVLYNTGSARGEELILLINEIRESISANFGLYLLPEVIVF